MPSLSYVTITGTFDDGSDTPLSGQAVFTPSQTVYASGVPVVSAGNPVTVPILSGVLQTVRLLATDNAGLSYLGLTGFFFWTVSVTLGGAAQPGFSFFLPSSPGTVDLYHLANTSAGGSFANPMTTAGDMIDGGSAGAAQRLAGNTTTASQFLNSTGSGSAASAPQWKAIAGTDLAATASEAGYSPLLLSPAAGLVWGYPWKFDLFSYGAKGDGVIVTDGVMNSSSPNLACTTSAPFKSGDVGKAIVVGGAGGGAFTPLVSTIRTFTDSAHVVLNNNAASSVTSAITQYATDDTAAILAAKNAAYAYFQAHPGSKPQITIDPFLYGVAGAPFIGSAGGFSGNAQIPFELVATTGEKYCPEWTGTEDVTPLLHWQQTVPQYSGAWFMCLRNDGTNDVTNGPAFVIGGPVNGYGGGDSVFTNMCPSFRGLGILVPYNGTYGGLGLYGVAEASVPNFACMAAAVVPGSSSVPTMGNNGNISNQWPVGLQMPDVNNNDNANIGNYSCEGLCIGVQLSEHSTFSTIRVINCVAGVQIGSWSSSAAPHGIRGSYISAENNDSHIVGLKATSKVQIGTADLEGGSNWVFDPSNFLTGMVGLQNIGTGYSVSPSVSGAANLKIINLDQPIGVAASPPALTNGTAVANNFFRDASVRVSGSVSSVAVDGTQIGTSSGGGYVVPSGHTITVTGTGSLSWNWVLT